MIVIGNQLRMKKKLGYFLLFLVTLFSSCKENTLENVESNCDHAISIPTNTAPFSDNFESYNTFSTPSTLWTCVREKGLREFMVVKHQGNNFIEMTAFNSNEDNKVWFISPRFDFDTMLDKNMSFVLADGLQNGNPLRVMYSNDYDGSDCPSTFNWVEIGSNIVNGLINNTDNNDFIFESTGDINLTSIHSNAVIAFVYDSNEAQATTTIQIDDVRIGQSLAFVPSISISGNLEVGEVLTANYSPLIDVQGNPVSISYQWYRADTVTGTNEVLISGATNQTYSLVNLDSGKYITVKATVNSSVTTAAFVGVITGINTPPTAGVIITGTTANPGDVLTADTSSSNDVDGDPLTFTYQWYRSDTNSGAGEVAISGQTGATYTIATLDFGKYIRVKVVANDGMLDSTEVASPFVYIPYSSKIFINELADPNNATRGRFVELYNAGNTDIDLTNWKLIRYTNGSTTPSDEEQHLVGIINANSTFVIGKVSDPTTTTDDFESIYGFPPDQAADPHSNGTLNMVVTPIDSNGDDQILLIAPDGNTMDIFGVIGEDGSGTAHEFEDGKAVRKLSVNQGSATWISSEWDVWNDTGANGTINDPQNAPDDFTPGIR